MGDNTCEFKLSSVKFVTLWAHYCKACG